MAPEPTSRVVAFPAPAAGKLRVLESPAQAETEAVKNAIGRRFEIALPIVNVTIAAVTYVFIDYVVPLPGPATPAEHRIANLVAITALIVVCWSSCRALGMLAIRPVSDWLSRGGPPEPAERARTIRMPMYEAAANLMVWSLAAIVFGVIDVAQGGSVAAAALICALVVLGGLSASALAYLATEWIMRPAVALALESGLPERPLLPGIIARVYLAWEFGTAVAVLGVAVVAIAYLAGAHMSPHRMAATVIFLAAIALTVGLVTLLLVTYSIAQPIGSVRRAMARIKTGETDLTVPVDDGSEVGLLQAGLNQMLAGLRERDRIRDLFGRHVGEEVARAALARGLELGGELRDAAVMFVDVLGSTELAATGNPHDVVAALNRFFGIVVEVVTVHGGWVNKFEGDAALCVFGAPGEHPDAAGAALAAGRELRSRLDAELRDLDAAIGLSAGRVVAGNVGAANRFEYTVIGDPVNEAARLTELAKGRECRLLASDAIVRRAGGQEATRWTIGDAVQLRGRALATAVAEPA